MVDSQTNVQTTTITTIWLSPTDNTEDEENKQIIPQKKPKVKKSVRFSEDTVDNESLSRLKSNICCIYHKPKKNIDDASSSSTCSSDDSENELERSRETKKKHKEKCSKQKKKHECCNHDENNNNQKQK